MSCFALAARTSKLVQPGQTGTIMLLCSVPFHSLYVPKIGVFQTLIAWTSFKTTKTHEIDFDIKENLNII